MTMAFSTKFSVNFFLKQVEKLTDPQKESITKVGFGHLLHIPHHFLPKLSNQFLRRSQLLELIEKWNIERQSFMFPPGDITITHLDVVLILGLRVIGQPVVLKEDTTPLSTLEQEFGASRSKRFITVESLKERLESCGERADSSFVRVFLLYCFGILLFPSESGKVDSRYLLLLEDLDNVSSFAWGAAVREDLHESLTLWKSKKSSKVRGCLILLQIWCYEHIVVGRPKLLNNPSTFPRVWRWESSSSQYPAIKFEELDRTEAFLSLLTLMMLWRLEPTSEEIQIDIIKEIPQEWYLIGGRGTMEEPIHIESERVHRKVRVQKKKREEEEEKEEKEKEKEEKEEEEETVRQQISTILVLSDDDESNSMEGLKEEVLELKATVEVLKKENEELMMFKKENEELRMFKKENEELRILVEKLQRDKMLTDTSISNFERILSQYP